jgi:hypothetical protein
VSRTRIGLLGTCLALALVALAGCGGDDDEGGGGQTTPAAAGASETLDESQWQEYQTSEEAFATANREAVAKVNACERTSQSNTELFDECVGDELENVVAASDDLRTTLDGFEGEVAGACESARAAFSGYLRNFEATASSLNTAVQENNVTGFSAGLENLKTVAAAGTPAKQVFESSCAPASG